MPSKSKQQQKFMGIVRAIQKGEAPAGKFSKAAQKAAKSMKKSSVRKYAKTKHDDLPKKVKEEKKRDYKAEYKKFQSSTKSKKYRAELNKYNRKKGTYGNGDGKDASHKGGKIVGFESQSKNRGRAEKSRLKKEGVLTENPAAIAAGVRAAMARAKEKELSAGGGKKVKVSTALANKSHPKHKQAKGIIQRIKDKAKSMLAKSKKKKVEPKKQSKSDANFYARQFGAKSESVDERLKKGQKIIALNPKDKTLKGKVGVIYSVGIGNSTSYVVQVGKGKKTRFAIMTDKEIKLKESVDERIPAGEQKLVYQFKKLSTSQMDELDAMFARAGINGVPDFNKKTWSTYANRDAMKLKKNKTLQKFIKLKGGQQIKEGFGGELKGSAKKKFENDRKKNGEQLGYTLTGESDVKEILQRVVKEEVFNILEDKDIGHQDDEPDMLKKTALEITEYGKKLHDALDKYDDMDTEVDFPNWWQSKLILSKDYLQKAYHYLDSEEKTESVNERMDKRQAGETLKQLGGNKFIAMTGAKNFAVGPKGMGFKIGRNSKSINYVRIDLKSNDLYDMEFIRLRKSQIKVVKRVTGVYNDQLQKMFTKYTGMYTSL